MASTKEPAEFIEHNMLEKTYLTVTGVALLLRYSENTVMTYARESGLPRHGKNRYPLMGVIHWHMDRQLAKTAGEGTDLADERKKLVVAQRQKAETENAIKKGELIEAEVVSSLLNEMSVIFARELEGTPARLAQSMALCDDPTIIQKTLNDEIRSIRSRASQAVENFASSYRSGEDIRAAAGA